MRNKLGGKVAVVTASTAGIGLAIAKRLGQDGAKVVVCSRKRNNVDETVLQLQNENIDVYGTVCHVGKKEDRARLIAETTARYGGIDILVSNAAVSVAFGPIIDTTENQWDKMFDVNVKSSFSLCQEVVPSMEKRGGGCIVLVSSVVGYVPSEILGVYSLTKTALLSMVKALTKELAAKNIRINGIAPGLIETRSTLPFTTNKHMRNEILNGIPMKRFGVPEDCSGLVSFLVSDDASYITGENIVIAGGTNSRL